MSESKPERILELPRLPPRRADSHKGDYGRALIVAGSRGFCGAAVLCGNAALRGGAGLVTVACPIEVQDTVAAGNPCYMTAALPERAAELPPADVVAIGPGLGQSHRTTRLVRGLIAEMAVPLVIDADALGAVVPGELSRPVPAILTPHSGEFARMTDKTMDEVQSHRESLAVAYAEVNGVVLLLKGSGTIVTDGSRVYTNTTGNPGMATGGCGDVLTGLIAALLAQKLAPFDAAVLGAWIHGRAGDLAAARFGEVSLTALDLLDYLPDAILETQR